MICNVCGRTLTLAEPCNNSVSLRLTHWCQDAVAKVIEMLELCCTQQSRGHLK